MLTADIVELPKLPRDEDQVIFADAGYACDDYKKGSRHLGLSGCVNDKRKPGKNLSSSQRKRNRKYSSVRARVEHIFHIIKCYKAFVRRVTGAWRKTPPK